jgi:uncharacterized protein (DUF433 family)
MDYRERITIEPDKLGGKPCIRGLRITVYDVLDYLASGMSQEEILRDFPDLTPEDIRACLAFAAERERRLMALRPREAPTNPASPRTSCSIGRLRPISRPFSPTLPGTPSARDGPSS